MNYSQIEEFVTVLRDSKLAEIEVRQGDAALRLRRAPRRSAPARPVTTAVPEDTTAPTRAQEPPATAPLVRVTATLVGVFHCPREPLTIGDRVTEQQVLGHIESMRLMNECFAPATGTITAVLVEDGQPVEYGQTLFEIAGEAKGAES